MSEPTWLERQAIRRPSLFRGAILFFQYGLPRPIRLRIMRRFCDDVMVSSSDRLDFVKAVLHPTDFSANLPEMFRALDLPSEDLSRDDLLEASRRYLELFAITSTVPYVAELPDRRLVVLIDSQLDGRGSGVNIPARQAMIITLRSGIVRRIDWVDSWEEGLDKAGLPRSIIAEAEGALRSGTE